MNIIEQASKVLAEIDEQLAICEKATAGPWTLGKGFKTIREQDKAGPFGFVARTHLAGEFCPRNDKEKNDNASFIASSRTVCPKALRCLKVAIEGCLDKRSWDDSIHQMYIRQDAEEILTEIIAQWNENK